MNILHKRFLLLLLGLCIGQSTDGAALSDTATKINALVEKINNLAGQATAARNTPKTMLRYIQLAESALENSRSLFNAATKDIKTKEASLTEQVDALREQYNALLKDASHVETTKAKEPAK